MCLLPEVIRIKTSQNKASRCVGHGTGLTEWAPLGVFINNYIKREILAVAAT